ncbi:tRNA (adenine57-N1/adenine58-N1)-methyltransferase [Acetomicrobium thermoterrenum DSM 13490]|uniref:tRNA (adenine(58)-N(1))-methyltransferase TrmI n=1 Tax=Acetomicrobium thermoterrenum DSM 13490 TaxID=1120987 RepID=A0A1H3DAK8_9BACT|nr:tRNA (adenine-N1)-methyltransferase [Acetomicrobium thermoterrenum]SDX63435.1 tRNA (adenine57-N1/adenine58-N1)-methyltransferase [Acetomicrobium thermoterrenum DSM 13490]
MIDSGSLVFLSSAEKKDTFLISLEEGGKLETRLGVISHEDVMRAGFGGRVRSHNGNLFYITKPSLGEYLRRIKRRTQIVFPKEAGYILLQLDVKPGARVLECGTGSGGMTSVFAHFVGDEGRVYSYDERGEFVELARRNCKRWKVDHRVEFKTRNISEGFDEVNVDALFLDLPDPWNYLNQARNALALGRRMGALLPTFNQIERFLRALQEKGFIDVEVIEIFHRNLKTDPNRIRPEDRMIGHTGYLIFATSVIDFDGGV